MNLLNDWLPESLLQVLGWTLVHSVWQWIILAGLLWGGLKIFAHKSPQFKYKLALASLGLGFLTSVGTLWYELNLNSLSNASPVAVLIDWNAQIGATDSPSLLSDFTAWIESLLPFLVNVWFFGAVLFLVRLFTNLSAVRNLRNQSQANKDQGLQKLVSEISTKMGMVKNPQLKITADGLSPMAMGLIKPMILIPAGLIFQLSPRHLEAILAHELAHIKRNDYLINLIQTVMEVLFFYHPCFWWINQTIKELRENATDDLAISSGVAPQVLAEALAEVLNYANEQTPELALAAAKKRNPTLNRIRRMLGLPAQNYPQNPIITIPMILSLIISASLITAAQQVDQESLNEILPEIALENPMLDAFSSIAPLQAAIPADTTSEEKKKVVVISKEDGNQAWTDENGNQVVIRQRGNNNSFVFRMNGDTLIVNGDTTFNFSKIMNLDEIPTMDFEDFPEIVMAPMTPMPPFPEGFMQDFDMDFFPPDAPFVFEFEGEAPGVFFFSDTTKMTEEERKDWQRKHEERMKEFSERMAERSTEWKERMAELQVRQQARMKEWEAEMAPKMKEWEEKMKAWQEEQEPRMEEFRAKMKEWQESNEPKMEEFRKKMEAWEKENAEKMAEFKKSLEAELEKMKKEKDN
ncbi:M56 family metallopeptidase [Algoriphagus hitonicola]|uniref:Signal transducer regulating beta-lactamase production, contains metallopeptidase domain n=1 Tax=Algoriphagus hitonicola TaxID=435880 RepID=A0A1I2URJ9_9BACT|nr:M56 family metallopeptidase [Algoriphagus hitonicola]SFG78869.1 Signal transducer regulating beta-lactamase production, contains metallopeptidase domain [Algoriphagus hitonicola]